MCGILFSVRGQGCDNPELRELLEDLKLANAARGLSQSLFCFACVYGIYGELGPDAQDSIQFSVSTKDDTVLDVRFFGSELRLRGNYPVVQPQRDASTGDVFCWNGEVCSSPP